MPWHYNPQAINSHAIDYCKIYNLVLKNMSKYVIILRSGEGMYASVNWVTIGSDNDDMASTWNHTTTWTNVVC